MWLGAKTSWPARTAACAVTRSATGSNIARWWRAPTSLRRSSGSERDASGSGRSRPDRSPELQRRLPEALTEAACEVARIGESAPVRHFGDLEPAQALVAQDFFGALQPHPQELLQESGFGI